jgi:hypothetical protein
MFGEQLIKKKEENMILGLWRRRGVFFSLLVGCLTSLLFFFYILGTQVSILQNSPPLNRQFTFKYFNNCFPKKEKWSCMKSSSFDLEELNVGETIE